MAGRYIGDGHSLPAPQAGLLGPYTIGEFIQKWLARERQYTLSNTERSKQSQVKLLPALVGAGALLVGGILAWLVKRRK